MVGYDTLDDAAAAALLSVSKEKHAHKQEYIGILYQDPKTGKYMFTPPQTKGQKESTGGKFDVPKGSARGIYHNHPTTKAMGGEKFSDDDVRQSNSSGLQSYIAYQDDIYHYDPKTKARPMRRGTRGDEVLAAIPLDQLPQKKPVLSKQAVVDTIMKDPDKYRSNQFQSELTAAIREGRLVD